MKQTPAKLRSARGSLLPLLAAFAFAFGFGLGTLWNQLLGGYGVAAEGLIFRVLLAGLLSMTVLRTQAIWGGSLRQRLGLVFLYLFGLGPGAEAWLHATAAWLQFAPPSFTWSAHQAALTLAALFGSLALVGLNARKAPPLPPVLPTPDLATTQHSVWRAVLVLALCATFLRLAIGLADALHELGTGNAFSPLEVANPWLRLQGLGGGLSSTGLSIQQALGFLLLLCLREGLRLAPLCWWMRRVHALKGAADIPLKRRFLGWFWPLFVLGEFTPLLLGETVFSAQWLGLRLLVGVSKAAILACLGLWWFHARRPNISAK